MPNNFKLTGNYYVSKFGNDSWSGTSPDAPKRTIQAALTAITSGQTIIVGAGVYNETLSRTTGAFSFTIKGDGYVVFEGFGLVSSTITLLSASGTATIENVEIRNYRYILGPANSTGTVFTSCVFKNCWIYMGGAIATQSNNKYINCNISFGVNAVITHSKCIFINTKIGVVGPDSSSHIFYSGPITNCYFNANSAIYFASIVAAANFNYNNIQCGIAANIASAITTGVYRDISGNYYDLSIATSTGTGTVSDPYGRPLTNGRAFGFTNHRALYPTFNASSSAVDPRFNSVENYDFSLGSDSPMIGAASDATNIGGTNYGVRNPATSTAFSGSSATVDAGLAFRYTNYVISGSAVTGSVTSAPILVNNIEKKVLQKVTYNGLLAFNKDTGSISGSNVNVPDVETFTSASGNAGANPDRLVYYMRFTSGSAMPTTDVQWENAGLWPAGSYNVFEWNTKPSIDLSGRGNGSSSFNPADSQTFIQAQWIQLQIKLRNDYLL